MSLVEVPLADLIQVLPFRAEADVRYYLNGILISPYKDGALLVATNGHMLAAVESKESHTDVDRILDIPSDFARVIRDEARNSGRKLVIEDEKARSIITDVTGTREKFVKAGKPFIDGKYPDWKPVVPKVEGLKPGLVSPLNAKYLAILKRALPNHMTHQGVWFWHQEKNPQDGAVVARMSSASNLIIVIMPMKHDVPASWPEWVPRESPPKVEAPVATESAA